MSSDGSSNVQTNPDKEPKLTIDSSSLISITTVSQQVTEQTTSVQTSVQQEYIKLRVITSDMTNEVHFRVRMETNLGRMKRSYCNKMNFEVDQLRFMFDGHRICDNDTPKSLGMMNDDVIEIYEIRIGGNM